MAKLFETIFRISGQIDSSLTGAIQSVRNQLQGLSRIQARGGMLSSQLAELQRVQAMAAKYAGMQRQMSTTGGTDAQRAALARLASELSRAGFAADKFGASMLRLLSQIARNTAEADKLKAVLQAQERFNQAGAGFNTATSNMSNAIGTAQTIMEPFKAAVDNAETFEHAMSRVKALTQSTNIREGNFDAVRREMKELEAQARELGATTQFTMTEAAQAQGFLGMAGWNKDQIIKAMPGMLDLAAASGMDLARTADIVSDNLTALGMNAGQVGHMTDVYAYALTRSNLNMEALGESMKYAAPAMHAYGGDIHDAAAAMMIMGNAGIKGSMAGTALRMGLLRLAGPPKKASKEMDALGISLSDATRMAYESQAQLDSLGIHLDESMPPTEKMSYVLRELGAKMEGLSKDEKLAAVGAIFGVNAASGWLSILEQGPEQFEEFRNALRESDGTAKQVAVTMNDDTRGAWLYLESAIDAVSNNIGSAFLPALKSTYESLNPVVTNMAKWIGEHPAVVQGFGAIAAAVAGGVVALGGFRVALAGVNFVRTSIELMQASAALRAFQTGASAAGGVFPLLTGGIKAMGASLATAMRALMTFAFTPWGAALAALAGAAALIYANWDKVGPYFEALVSRIKNAFAGLKNLLDASGITATITSLMEKLGLVEAKMTNRDRREQVRQELGEQLTGELELKQENLDELTRQTRTILRTAEGKDDKTIADELWSVMSKENQTDAGQVQMREMLRREMKARGDWSEDRRAAIENDLNSRMYTAKEDSMERVLAKLTETATKQDLKTSDERGAYLATAREALMMQRGLSESEKASVYGRLSEQVKEQGAVTDVLQALTSAMQGEKMSTLTEQTAAVEKMMLTMGESNATVQLTALEKYLQSRSEVTDSALSEMMVTARERMQAATDERMHGELTNAIASANDRTALTNALTSIVNSQKDQSSAAMEMMMKSVGSELKSSGRFEGEQLTAILKDVAAAVKSRQEESRSAREKESWATAPVFKETSTTKEMKYQAVQSLPWQNLSPTLGNMPIQLPSKTTISTQSTELSTATPPLSTTQTTTPPVSAPWMATTPSATSTTITSPTTQSTTIDTSPLQNAANVLQDAGSTMQNASVSMQETGTAMQNASVSMQETGAAMQNETTGLFEGARMESEMLASSMTMTDGVTQAFNASLLTSEGATQVFNAGVTNAGSAAVNTAGALSGLGTAASSAISALMSAASSAGAAISSAVSSAASYAASAASAVASAVGIKSNAVGGIYRRGEFLTTFAEDSPEAAIPIDGSRRSIELWKKTGELLGIYSTNRSQEGMQTAGLTTKDQQTARLSATDQQTTFRDRQSTRLSTIDRQSMFRDHQTPRLSIVDRQPTLRERQTTRLSTGDPQSIFRDIGSTRVLGYLQSLLRDVQKTRLSTIDQQTAFRDEQTARLSMSDQQSIFRDIGSTRMFGYLQSLLRDVQSTRMSIVDQQPTFRDEQTTRLSTSDQQSIFRDIGSTRMFGYLQSLLRDVQSTRMSISDQQTTFRDEQTTRMTNEYRQGELPDVLGEYERSATETSMQMNTPIELHFHFEGNVNREEVERGVRESLPMLRETFEEQFARYRHEKSRRSFE